jgi:hypothetical protein
MSEFRSFLSALMGMIARLWNRGCTGKLAVGGVAFVALCVYLSEAMLGDKWPLTVSEGIVKCIGPGTAIVFQTDQGLYTVNGAARGQMKANGWKDIYEFRKPDPSIAGPFMNVQPIIDAGLALC